MGTVNSTYNNYQQGQSEGHDAYVLSNEIAASLRVPKIEYPNNKIPASVAKCCFPDGLSCPRLQDATGELLLVDVMNLIESSILSNGLACGSCRAVCERAGKNSDKGLIAA